MARLVIGAAMAALAWLSLGLLGGEAAIVGSRAPDGRPLRLTFSEDFHSLDAAPVGHPRWRTIYGDGADADLGRRTHGDELEIYVDPSMGDRLDPFLVRGGGLDIVARPAPSALASQLAGHPFTSGLISSQPSFAQRYGYFEIRARLPAGKGLWPAIWLLPADNTWPPEIDIMESIGDPHTVYTSLHSKAAPTFSKEVRVGGDGFHTFAVSWDPRDVVWYVDGGQVARQPTPPDMNKPMFLIVNLAVGGAWAGTPDASTPFPAVFSINSIRVYQFAQ
jgi:hypothetical protein